MYSKFPIPWTEYRTLSTSIGFEPRSFQACKVIATQLTRERVVSFGDVICLHVKSFHNRKTKKRQIVAIIWLTCKHGEQIMHSIQQTDWWDKISGLSCHPIINHLLFHVGVDSFFSYYHICCTFSFYFLFSALPHRYQKCKCLLSDNSM